MKPLNEMSGHRFGVNRILRLGDDLLSAGRDGVVRRWDVSSVMARGGNVDAGRREGAMEGRGGGGRGVCGRDLLALVVFFNVPLPKGSSFYGRNVYERVKGRVGQERRGGDAPLLSSSSCQLAWSLGRPSYTRFICAAV